MIAERVEAAYRRIAEVDRPEVWIVLRAQHDVLRDAAEIEVRVAAGEVLPLAGTLLAVKDNIDIARLPTTAGCPAYSYLPGETAPSVQRLLDAGALVLGKTKPRSVRYRPGGYPKSVRGSAGCASTRVRLRWLEFGVGGGGGARHR